MKNITFHPIADLFPIMPDSELRELAEDIKLNKQREPILMLDNQILDGRNRFKACEIAGVKPKFEEYHGKLNAKALAAFVTSANIKRRHLTESQRAMLLVSLATYSDGSSDPSIAEAAKLSGTSTGTIKKAKRVKKKALKAIKKAVMKGELTLNAADRLSKLSPKEQRKEVKKGAKSMREKAASMKPLARGGLAADAIRAEREAELDLNKSAKEHAEEVVTKAINGHVHDRLKAAFLEGEQRLQDLSAYTSGLTVAGVLEWAIDILEADRKANS